MGHWEQKLVEGIKKNPRRQNSLFPHFPLLSAWAEWARMWKCNAPVSIWKCTSSVHVPIHHSPPPHPLHLPPLKQLCCFGPALKAVLITGTEHRSEWQAGSILLKPNERNLCRVWGLQRPEEAEPLLIVLFLSSLFFFYSYRIVSISKSSIFAISTVPLSHLWYFLLSCSLSYQIFKFYSTCVRWCLHSYIFVQLPSEMSSGPIRQGLSVSSICCC